MRTQRSDVQNLGLTAACRRWRMRCPPTVDADGYPWWFVKRGLSKDATKRWTRDARLTAAKLGQARWLYGQSGMPKKRAKGPHRRVRPPRNKGDPVCGDVTPLMKTACRRWQLRQPPYSGSRRLLLWWFCKGGDEAMAVRARASRWLSVDSHGVPGLGAKHTTCPEHKIVERAGCHEHSVQSVMRTNTVFLVME